MRTVGLDVDDEYEVPEDEDYEELPPKRWPVFVAAILVVALIGTYAASELLSTEVLPRIRSNDPTAFEFLSLDPETGEPLRYNPCRPIRYVINPRSAPPSGVQDVKRGFEMLSRATGMDFAYEGATDEAVTGGRESHQPHRYGPGWAPILVGWVNAGELEVDGVDKAGTAGSVVAQDRENIAYVTGSVVLNADARVLDGYALGVTSGDVILHELGHLVGLAHVGDRSQIMFPNVTEGPAEYGAGDLAGLRRVGRVAGCLEPIRP